MKTGGRRHNVPAAVSGGTGKFTWLNASVVVSRLVRPNWAWDGKYSFSDKDDRGDKD